MKERPKLTSDAVMTELERMGTEQNRKIYARHGATGELFGVSFADLYSLQKRIGIDDQLADQLWATRNCDARILALLVRDPKTVTLERIKSWVADSHDYGTVGSIAALVAKSPVASEVAFEWRDDPDEWRGMVAWTLLAVLAVNALGDEQCLDLINQIEREIHTRPNRVRYSMNSALISIGARSEALKGRALEAAAAIGKVYVDHGQTGCKTPDAAQAIEKTFAHRHRKR